jgi:hypothetical protein
MPCNASYARFIFFWKVFHKYYNFIYTPICTKFLFLQKVGVTSPMGSDPVLSGRIWILYAMRAVDSAQTPILNKKSFFFFKSIL